MRIDNIASAVSPTVGAQQDHFRSRCPHRSGSPHPFSTHGSGTWPLLIEDIRKLELFDQGCLRLILKVTLCYETLVSITRESCFDIKSFRSAASEFFPRRPNTEISRRPSPVPCLRKRCRLKRQLKT